MVIDGVFYIKGRGDCITGCVPLDKDLPELGDSLYEVDTNRFIGIVRGVEMSIGNFGRREHIGIIFGAITRPVPPKEGDEIYW